MEWKILLYSIWGYSRITARGFLSAGMNFRREVLPVMRWYVTFLLYYAEAPNYNEDISNIAVPVLQRTFASDHLKPTDKKQNSFVRVCGKNGVK